VVGAFRQALTDKTRTISAQVSASLFRFELAGFGNCWRNCSSPRRLAAQLLAQNLRRCPHYCLQGLVALVDFRS